MDDLIININFNESQKQGKTIIETYSGRIKKIKKWLSPRSLREFNFKYSKRHRTNIGSMLYFSY